MRYESRPDSKPEKVNGDDSRQPYLYILHVIFLFIQQLQIVSVRRQAVLTSALLILSRQALHALHYAKEYTMSSYFLRARCR